MKTASVLILLTTVGCLSRAPSHFELYRRSGLDLPHTEKKNTDSDRLAYLKEGAKVSFPPTKPVYQPPRLEEVYVYPMEFADKSRLSGTWMWMVMDDGRWSEESSEKMGAQP